MIDLSSHIEYLLLSHDCVVVPGLGAFLVYEEPARYDGDSALFFPPHRSLGFNPAVTHSDGLLVGSVARKERISIEAASQHIQAEVLSFRHQLSQTGELPVGSLGVLSVGAEPDALLFEPSDNSSVDLKYRGLAPVESHVLAEEAASEQGAEIEPVRMAAFPLPLKIAASIVFLLVACGLLYSTTNLVGGESRFYATLDSGLSERVEISDPRTTDADKTLSREIVLNIAGPHDGVGNRQIAVSDPKAAVTGRYLLVVASFPSMKAAERHISYVGGDDLSVIEMDGNFRVYAKACATNSEAYAAAAQLRDRFPSVWVCKR